MEQLGDDERHGGHRGENEEARGPPARYLVVGVEGQREIQPVYDLHDEREADQVDEIDPVRALSDVDHDP